MPEALLMWLVIVIATHSISHTMATQKIFKPIRDYLSPMMGEFWSDLVKCPFCIAHYISLGLLLITGLRLTITDYYLIDLFILWQATVGVANYITWILCDKIKSPSV